MNKANRCPACGGPLAQGRLEGICPACAWSAEPEEDFATPTPQAEGVLMRLAGYEVLNEIARGGMGIVYRARQLDPLRIVALKMLLPHQLGSVEMAERFRLEVRALTQLEHPAILPVYQVGEQDGLPFFTMKLANGGTLGQRNQELAGKWRAIAELVATLADAIQFAHERGVVHRDLKPGNVLFDEAGRAYVTDFGLAKLAGTDSELTRSAGFLGTPHYVAPEVAANGARNATAVSDIYSLGAVLYELLTGHPPFEADGIPALLKEIVEREPVSPSKLWKSRTAEKSNREPVPVDLEIICLKCLAKAPDARYGSAGELAQDLRRHLTGEPIVARPPSQAYRLQKLVRRHRGVSILTGALVVLLAAGGAMVWRAERRLHRALQSPKQNAGIERERLEESVLAEAGTIVRSGQMGQRSDALAALKRAGKLSRSLEARNAAAAALARTDLRELTRFPVAISNGVCNPVAFMPDLEHFVAAHPEGGFTLQSIRNRKVLARLQVGTGKLPESFVIGSDGNVVIARDSQNAEVWSLSDQRLMLSLAGTPGDPAVADVHPDGQRIAGYTPSGGLFLQRLGESERTVLDTNGAGRTFLRFSPDGLRLAAVQKQGFVEVWNLAHSLELAWTQQVERVVSWLAWNPDGSQLLAAGRDGRGIRVLNAASGTVERFFDRHKPYPRQYEFHPDGRIVASVGQDSALRLWDARTGQHFVFTTARQPVTRFSLDGRRVAAAISDQEMAILELVSNDVFREFQGPPSAALVVSTERSPNGRLLATIGREVRLWDTLTGRNLGVAQVPGLAAGWVVFDPHASELVISAQDSDVRFFHGKVLRLPFKLDNTMPGRPGLEWGKLSDPLADQAGPIGFTSSGRDFWVLQTNQFGIWPDGKKEQARTIQTDAARAAASPDGKWIALHRFGGPGIHIHEGGSGKPVTTLPALGADNVWFSPDSQWLVVSRRPDGYSVFSVGDWRPGPSWPARLDIYARRGDAAISDDGRLLVARQERETFRLFSFPACQELVTLTPPYAIPAQEGLRFSTDGLRLWIVAGNHRVFEWNLGALRKELASLGLDWN